MLTAGRLPVAQSACELAEFEAEALRVVLGDRGDDPPVAGRSVK